MPFLAGRVNDLARMIPADTRERLETRLRALEERSGAQVAVLTVDSLEGEPLEEYAERVFRTWALGRRGVDDGVLLLVARQERQMRIEVGYGLEPRLTDAVSRQILDDHMRPHFRRGEFGKGVEAAVDAIAATIEGQPLPAAPARAGSRGLSIIGMLLFAGLFTVTVGTFSLVALLAPGFLGWFLYFFLLPFYVAFPSAIFPPYGGLIAGGAWLVLFPILRAIVKPTLGKKLRARGWVLSPGAGSSGGGRWRSSGGSSGGGGFSGGGGRSGGGGASSSW